MSRFSRGSWKILVLVNFSWLAILQPAANAQNESTMSLATSISLRLMPSATVSPVIVAPSPSVMNTCREFNGSLNPCGLASDQLYYYSNDKSDSEFLQNMAIISTLTSLTDESTAECGARLADFACRYLFPRCNNMMLPMAPCQDYCICTLQVTCQAQWVLISSTIKSMFGGYNSSFTMLIDEISARGGDCDNLELYSDQINYAPCDELMCIYPSSSSSQPESPSQPEPSPQPEPYSLSVILGIVLSSAFLLLFIICFVFCCCYVWYRKNRKMSDAFFFHKDTADYLRSGDTSILRLARIKKRSKFKSPRELLKHVPALYSELMVRNAEYLIQESRIHTTSFLAEGAFSEVYLGNIIDLQPYDTSTFRSVVIKQFKDGISDAEIVHYLEMCLTLGSVSHPHVITIIGISFNNIGAFSMIYPYFEEHDLLTHLRKKRSNIASGKEQQEFSVDTLSQVVFQICQGMKAIARMHIVYKTLCAQACMVHNDGKQQMVIIGDISFSRLRDFSEEQSCSTSPHSRWLAPESILEGKFTEKSDVWSFGITCWEVFSFGSPPFADMDLSACTPTQRKPAQPSFCPDSLFAIVQSCWNKNETQRPSFADLVVRLDTLLAQGSYQRDITELDREIQAGILRPSAPSTLHSTSDEQNAYKPASKQQVEDLESSQKTEEGYLKVIGDQANSTTDGYSSFVASGAHKNDRSLHPTPAVDINNEEDPYGYVNVTPEPPRQTTTAIHVHNEVPQKPVTDGRDGYNTKSGVYDNLEGVVTSTTSTDASNQSKAPKSLFMEDTAGLFPKANADKAKKPAPLPKPSFPIMGSISQT